MSKFIKVALVVITLGASLGAPKCEAGNPKHDLREGTFQGIGAAPQPSS